VAAIVAPQHDGTVPVRASRHGSDRRDIAAWPTIRAPASTMPLFAIGVAHAQDRLFQMDMIRRAGAVRLSRSSAPKRCRSIS